MHKIKTRAIFIYSLAKETIQSFLAEKAFFHGAALAYYALFSLFPLLFLCVSLLGRYLGEELILQVISDFLVEKVGLTNVDEIMKIVGSYNLDKGSVVMELVGLAVILFASSGFIHSLKNSNVSSRSPISNKNLNTKSIDYHTEIINKKVSNKENKAIGNLI
jgi:membrane protein